MKKYDPQKYYMMVRIKQLIFTNQLKRLSKAGKRANFYIIYYSLSLIVYSIFKHFFPLLINGNWIDFSILIISIIILIYSIINSNSRYPERARNIEIALIHSKELKRRIANLTDIDNDADRKEEFHNIKNDYEELCKDVEFRDDLDFYYTVKYLEIQFGLSNRIKQKYKRNLESLRLSEQDRMIFIDEIKGYMAEVNPALQLFNLFIRRFWHLVLYALPVVIFVACVILRNIK